MDAARSRDRVVLGPGDRQTFFPSNSRTTAPSPPSRSRRTASAGSRRAGQGELTLWDLTTGEPTRWSLGPQQGEVSPHAMAFFPDGRRAATAGHDRLVHIWDLDTGHRAGGLEGARHDHLGPGDLARRPPHRDRQRRRDGDPLGRRPRRDPPPLRRCRPTTQARTSPSIPTATSWRPATGWTGSPAKPGQPDRVGRRHLRRTAPRREAVRQAHGRRRRCPAAVC